MSSTGFLSFVLPYDASEEQALTAIAAIQKHFNIGQPVAKLADEVDADEQPSNATHPAVDKNGLPWDERIHSSSKALNQDGSWRYKKGVTPQLKAKIEAELGATIAAPAQPAAAQLPPPPTLPLPAPAPVATAYSEFVTFLTANTQPNGVLTADWIKQLLINYGVADGNLQNLAHNEELCKTIHAAIKQVLGQ